MARRPGAGREGRAGHCWGAGPALEVGWRREMPSEVEEWEEAAGGARAGAGGRGPPREALAWGLPAGARDAAALERALLGALGGDVSVCGEVPEGAGGAEGFAAGGARLRCVSPSAAMRPRGRGPSSAESRFPAPEAVLPGKLAFSSKVSAWDSPHSCSQASLGTCARTGGGNRGGAAWPGSWLPLEKATRATLLSAKRLELS